MHSLGEEDPHAMQGHLGCTQEQTEQPPGGGWLWEEALLYRGGGVPVVPTEDVIGLLE